MIEISNIKKNYQNFRLECSLNIAPGRITGIIGANGAGKSTLFKAILGLINLDEGQIKIFGKDSRKLDVHDKEKLGVVLAESGFSEYLKVKALVPILKNMYPDFDKDMFLNKCNNFNIPLNKMIKDLSTGTKAKLKVIVAISHNAEILILDEPTAGLDPKERAYFRNIISEMSKDKIIIISTHIVSDIEYISDQVLVMKKGCFILQGTPEELLDKVNGEVWSCKIPNKEWTKFETQYYIANSHALANHVEARIISTEAPIDDAINVEPTLEDLYLKYFSDEMEAGENS